MVSGKPSLVTSVQQQHTEVEVARDTWGSMEEGGETPLDVGSHLCLQKQLACSLVCIGWAGGGHGSEEELGLAIKGADGCEPNSVTLHLAAVGPLQVPEVGRLLGDEMTGVQGKHAQFGRVSRDVVPLLPLPHHGLVGV